MLDNLKSMASVAGLLKDLPKIKERMSALKDGLAQQRVLLSRLFQLLGIFDRLAELSLVFGGHFLGMSQDGLDDVGLDARFQRVRHQEPALPLFPR